MKDKEKLALKIKKLNRQTNNLLSKKIDRFILLYENKNQQFFNDYRQLRDHHFQEPAKEK
jgi:hypothetical protein